MSRQGQARDAYGAGGDGDGASSDPGPDEPYRVRLPESYYPHFSRRPEGEYEALKEAVAVDRKNKFFSASPAIRPASAPANRRVDLMSRKTVSYESLVSDYLLRPQSAAAIRGGGGGGGVAGGRPQTAPMAVRSGVGGGKDWFGSSRSPVLLGDRRRQQQLQQQRRRRQQRAGGQRPGTAPPGSSSSSRITSRHRPGATSPGDLAVVRLGGSVSSPTLLVPPRSAALPQRKQAATKDDVGSSPAARGATKGPLWKATATNNGRPQTAGPRRTAGGGVGGSHTPATSSPLRPSSATTTTTTTTRRRPDSASSSSSSPSSRLGVGAGYLRVEVADSAFGGNATSDGAGGGGGCAGRQPARPAAAKAIVVGATSAQWTRW